MLPNTFNHSPEQRIDTMSIKTDLIDHVQTKYGTQLETIRKERIVKPEVIAKKYDLPIVQYQKLHKQSQALEADLSKLRTQVRDKLAQLMNKPQYYLSHDLNRELTELAKSEFENLNIPEAKAFKVLREKRDLLVRRINFATPAGLKKIAAEEGLI
jgi:hypothetical protein